MKNNKIFYTLFDLREKLNYAKNFTPHKVDYYQQLIDNRIIELEGNFSHEIIKDL